MPTLAPNSRSSGFTLVEVMTALFIVGLAASAVVLVAPGQDVRVREAAERLAGRLKAASDVSVMTNREIALVATPEGYGFERRDEAGWKPVESEPALAFHAWPEGIAPELPPIEDKTPYSRRLAEFDPLGGASPMKIVIGRPESLWRVEIDEAGDVHVARDR